MKKEKRLNDDTKNRKRSQKRRVIVHTVCAAVALIALIISVITFGWFSGSNSVDVGLNSFSAASGSYELAAVGENGKYDSFLTALDGVELSGIVDENDKPIAPVATFGGSEIKWMMNSESNFENNTENISKGIEPGSSGKLSFYVIAKQDTDLDLTFRLDKILYKGQLKAVTEENDNSQYIITDSIVADIVNGHILFFEDCTDGVYSNRIDDTFSFTQSGAKANTAYRVDIYWIWPSVVDQLVLLSSDAMFAGKPYKRIVTDADTGFDTDIKTNQNKYFISELPDISDMLDNMKIGSQNAGFNMDNYNLLNEEWNKADQKIGTGLSYIELKLTAN